MANVRITGSTPNNIHKTQWLGKPSIDSFDRLERTLDLPEAAYQRIEQGIARGATEGIVLLDDGRRLDWFLDRERSPAGAEAGCGGCGEGI